MTSACHDDGHVPEVYFGDVIGVTRVSGDGWGAVTGVNYLLLHSSGLALVAHAPLRFPTSANKIMVDNTTP